MTRDIVNKKKKCEKQFTKEEIMFKKAQRSKARLRMALVGPAGSGKTYTALATASHLSNKIALLDTEWHSSEKYAGTGDGEFEFDVCALDENFAPENYIKIIKAAEGEGYEVLIVDSLSPAWAGSGGALEILNDISIKQKISNKWAAWREVTPQHNRLVDCILQSPMHIIATLRSKTEWQVDNADGRKVPRKIGLAPIQREGIDYEFDIVGDLDVNHNLVITKTRCPSLDGKIFKKPGEDLAQIIKTWLDMGQEPAPTPQFSPPTQKTPITANFVFYNPELAAPPLRDLVSDKIIPWLKSKKVEDDIIDAGFKQCAQHFGIESLDELPPEKIDEMKSFIKKEILTSLKKEAI